MHLPPLATAVTSRNKGETKTHFLYAIGFCFYVAQSTFILFQLTYLKLLDYNHS